MQHYSWACPNHSVDFGPIYNTTTVQHYSWACPNHRLIVGQNTTLQQFNTTVGPVPTIVLIVGLNTTLQQCNTTVGHVPTIVLTVGLYTTLQQCNTTVGPVPTIVLTVGLHMTTAVQHYMACPNHSVDCGPTTVQHCSWACPNFSWDRFYSWGVRIHSSSQPRSHNISRTIRCGHPWPGVAVILGLVIVLILVIDVYIVDTDLWVSHSLVGMVVGFHSLVDDPSAEKHANGNQDPHDNQTCFSSCC